LNIPEKHITISTVRVLVTGGTGYLGAGIVRALHARGHRPVIFARRAAAAGLPGVPQDGDVRDRRALQLAAERVDAIVHAAALVSIWRPDPREFDDVNVNGLLNVLDVARAAAVPKIVYTSSFLALPPQGQDQPLRANDYQRTKVRALEEARTAAAAGVPIVIMIPGVVYGPGAHTEGNLVGRLIRDHMNGRLPGIIGADRIWSYSYVEDVANAHVEAVERPALRGEFLVGGANAPQMRVFEIVRELTGRSLPRRIPIAAASALGLLEEARARRSGRPPVVTPGAVKIFRCDWPLDSARTVRELNYRQTPLETGVARVLRHTG
jgi:nucleoside-diphosphate-sugar epimerase